MLMVDENYMHEAIWLAKNAKGRTSPNPMVGAIIVKDGRIVGQGWHRMAGTEHAEVHALNMAGDFAKGSTVYVSLEPCAHYGRTGPCAEALVKAGVSRVVIAMEDPNPKVSGKGIKILRDAGIEVSTGVLKEEAEKLNEVFLKWIQTGIPYVALKTAMTLDGKIATVTGESQWITNEGSRLKCHELRDVYDGILVGIGTVLADNPSLTTRIPYGKNPTRIVLDSSCRIPLDAKMLQDGEAPVIIAVTENADAERIKAVEAAGAKVIFAGSGPHVDLKLLLKKLGEMEICSLYVEGGSEVDFSFLEQGLVDRVYAFIAPIIVGGTDAKTPVGGKGFAHLKDAVRLRDIEYSTCSGDLLVTGRVQSEGKG